MLQVNERVDEQKLLRWIFLGCLSLLVQPACDLSVHRLRDQVVASVLPDGGRARAETDGQPDARASVSAPQGAADPALLAGGFPAPVESALDAGDGGVSEASTRTAAAAEPLVARCDDARSPRPCVNECGVLEAVGPTFGDDVRNRCGVCAEGDAVDADGDGIADACDRCGLGVALALQPVFYFALDERAGATAALNHGSANALAQLTGPVQAGRLGVGDTQAGAYYFPGAGQPGSSRLTVQNVSGWPSTALSATFWLRTTQQSDASILSYATVDGSSNEFGIIFEADRLRLAIEGTQVDVAGVPLSVVNDGLWHFIAISWGADRANVYLDGRLLAAVATPVVPSTGPAAFDPGEQLSMRDGGVLIVGQDQDTLNGSFSASQALVGGLDEVGIYARALSAAEIAELYEATTCGETCNGVDDELDGLVDEGFAGSGDLCPATSCQEVDALGSHFGSGVYTVRGAEPGSVLRALCDFD